MAKKSNRSSRTFAILAAILLFLSALALLGIGLIFLAVAGVVSSTVFAGSAVFSGVTSMELYLLGGMAVVLGLLYLVAMVGVLQGRRTYGYLLGVVLTSVAIAATLLEMALFSGMAFILAGGLIFPGITLLSLYLARDSFR